MRDPYSVLGVKRDAGADEIKAAWRSKAKSVHPDHNRDDPNATGRFAEVGQAYDVLKDPDKRRRYDTAADMHQTIMQQREAARQAEERAKAARANAEKVMEELARANAQRAQSQANAQAQARAQTQAQAQAQNRARAAAQAKPTAGSGTGTDHDAQSGMDREPEAAEDMIERIFGTGDEQDAPSGERQRSAQNRPQGQAQSQGQGQGQGQNQARNQAQGPAVPPRPQAQQQASRPASGGETATADTADAATPADDAARADAAAKPPLPLQAVDLIASLVRRIRGTAPVPEKAPDLTVEAIVSIEDLIARETATVHLPEERDIRIPLEAGMTDGHVLRLKGQGLKLPPAARGDLIVTVRVARHERFRLEGFDLHTVLPISLEDAVLGTEMEVETPGGKVPITIPPWSGSDRTISLDGLGLADGAGSRGALVVELRVVLWEKPDEKVTDLMRHMRHGLYV